MAIIVVPICGYCIHYKKDDDFPELFGNCEFKPTYVAYRAPGCRKWEVNVSMEMLSKIGKEFTG